MADTLRRNAYRQEFGSLGEFVEFAKAQKCGGGGDNPHTSDKVEFTGTRTFDEAVDLSCHWKKGAQEVAALHAAIMKNTQSAKKVTVRREVGPGTLSMGHYLQGHPKAYLSKVNTAEIKRAGRGKIVHVVVNGSASWMVDEKIIRTRGAAVASLVTALERAGRRVEVDVVYPVNASYGGNSAICTSVKVKRATAPLNLNTVVFALAHPSALRRFAFAAWWDTNNAHYREIVDWSYGRPTDLHRDDMPKGAIYLATMLGYQEDWNSPEAAAAWVARQAAEQGIHLG